MLQKVLRSAVRSGVRCMSNPAVSVPQYGNEPLSSFLPGSPLVAEVYEEVAAMRASPTKVPIVINGQELFTDDVKTQVIPHDHAAVLAEYSWASKDQISSAIQGCLDNRAKWEMLPFDHRAAVFLKAADLLAGKYRAKILASTMLGQAKTFQQADIDAVCETIDFYRFAVMFAQDLYRMQPSQHSKTVWNRIEWRGLEGFIAAISPFNFTAIGGQLWGTPALMGNCVVYKPCDTAMLSNWVLFEALREAGLPDGVVNYVPCDGPTFGSLVTSHPDLAGISFTGSSPTFKYLWKAVGANIDNYKTFPRLVGETGGKNYHLVHPTADAQSVVNGTILSAFEYSGQKCSACSRMYIPASLWPEIKKGLVKGVSGLKIGSAEEIDTFTSAVIDKNSFAKISGYLDYANNSDECEVLVGGTADDSVGYYIQPTIVQTSNPHNKLMSEEIFGPVLCVYVYSDDAWEETVKLVDQTSPYALTGSIFCKDRSILQDTHDSLRHTAGNIYFNDKSTGSVVGQQPFGGSRASGTNDKAVSLNLIGKWTSPQAIKETLVPLTTHTYPYMNQ